MSTATNSDQDEGFLAGLGYSGRTAEDLSHGVDELMKHYMQQCLEFHEEESSSRKHANGEGNNEPPVFLRPIKQDFQQAENLQVESSLSSVAVTEEEQTPHPNEAQQLEASRARAQAILARFQQQQQQQQQQQGSSVPLDYQQQLQHSPSTYARQREIAFAREEERKERCWAKNMDYSLRRQAERLQQEEAEIDAAQAWNNEYRAALEEQHLARYEQRKRAVTMTTAGIGTTKRRRAQAKATATTTMQQASTVAVYVSGFPTDEDDALDSYFVSQLFAAYGKVRKVHFYRDKSTGHPKGDGLIIYELKHDENADELLQSVCGQMNGAELPSGSQLRVEPSQSNYATSKTSTTVEKAADNSLAKEAPAEEKEPDEEPVDEELDDFFSSI